nr:hypothetical protein [Tanacetum cinerariifolium]
MRSFTLETLKQLMDEGDETMNTTIEQQVVMDEALVPHAQRLRIGRSNFRLLSDIQSKEYTLDMLHICLRVPGQSFDEPPFEEEILAFIRFLGHSVPIRMLTDVNINKLYQPWISFAAIINKCLTGKSSGYDSLRLSQAQILWALYHKRNVDYAYLLWEDFVYQVEHKNQKKRNEMYYPRFTKVIIHHSMLKDPLIPRRKKFGALLPIELTNDEIRNSKAYKEYYAIAAGEAAPKFKASVRRTRREAAPKFKAIVRRTRITRRSMQQTHISQPSGSGADEGTSSKPGVPVVPADESKEELSWNSTDDEEEGRGDDQESDEETREEESFDPIPQTPESSEDEGNGVEDIGLNVEREEGLNEEEEEEEDELYRDVNINQGR